MKIKHALETLDIEVKYDEDDIRPGAELQGSIDTLIKSTDFTVPIISRSSLTSPWVIWEISQKKTVDRQRLLPIHIDSAFLEDSYHSSLFEICSNEIKRIDTEINRRQQNSQPLGSAASDRELWLDYQGKLDKLIVYLKGLNVINLTQDNFRHGIADLCQEITGQRPDEEEIVFFPAESFGNTNLKDRKKVIYRLVANNSVSEAVEGTLVLAEEMEDFVEDIIIQATLISQRFRGVEQKYNIEGKEKDYLTELAAICGDLLKLLKEIPDSLHERAA